MLPRFDLSTVDGAFASQFAERFERCAEAAARSDLGKLVVVADEDDFGAGFAAGCPTPSNEAASRSSHESASWTAASTTTTNKWLKASRR